MCSVPSKHTDTQLFFNSSNATFIHENTHTTHTTHTQLFFNSANFICMDTYTQATGVNLSSVMWTVTALYNQENNKEAEMCGAIHRG